MSTASWPVSRKRGAKPTEPTHEEFFPECFPLELQSQLVNAMLPLAQSMMTAGAQADVCVSCAQCEQWLGCSPSCMLSFGLSISLSVERWAWSASLSTFRRSPSVSSSSRRFLESRRSASSWMWTETSFASLQTRRRYRSHYPPKYNQHHRIKSRGTIFTGAGVWFAGQGA